MTNPAMGPGPEVGATTAATATTAPAKADSKKRLTILIAAIVAVVLVVAGAGFGTYKAQLWGGKTVPSPASLGIAKSAKTHEFTAKDVEASLHKRGFKTVTVPTFSGKPKGTFLKYRNINPNRRYSTSKDRITLISSNGPGVPKGTKGQSVEKVVKTMGAMNVPVHYHRVVVTNQKTKAGTVIASEPSEGQPVLDTKTGINIGVAEQTKGIGYDVVGQDKDEARQQYASAGFTVIMRPRFSAKAKVGKIVNSNPKPGTETPGGSLVLYYGIDASGFKDAVNGKNVYANDPSEQDTELNMMVGTAAPVEGKYCTNAGKCIEFKNDNLDPSAAEDYVYSTDAPPQSGIGEKAGSPSALVFCGAAQQQFCNPEDDSQALYTQDAGAFELTTHDAAFNYTCGNTPMQEDFGLCVNGKRLDLETAIDQGASSDELSGAHYDMGPLYVYFPVGADVSKVVKSDYFDKDAVTKAEKQKKIDTSRPFFISRDKKLYDKTSLDITSLTTRNPYAPSFASKKKTLEPVKPAPSDETAYYLVDDPQLDWGSLPEYAVPAAGKDSGKTSGKNAKQPKADAHNATPDQITAALKKNDFTLVAGKYCTKSDECVQINQKGLLTGGGGKNSMLEHATSQLALSVTEEDGGGASYTVNPKSPFLQLHGPDSEYQCSGGTGLDQCKGVMMNQMTSTPTSLIYVFKGADTSGWYTNPNDTTPTPGYLYDGPQDGTPAKTDRPYLSALNSHSTSMLTPPSDDDVYYLQD